MRLCAAEVTRRQRSLGKDEVVLLGLCQGDGALVAATHLVVLRIEEVQARQGLEPVAPDGFLCTIEYAVLVVKMHLTQQISLKSQRAVGMCDCQLSVAQAMGGTGSQGVDKGAVVIVLRQQQGLFQHIQRLLQVLAPLHGGTAILVGQGTEEVTRQQVRIGLYPKQVEAVGIGSLGIGCSHRRQAIIRHLA